MLFRPIASGAGRAGGGICVNLYFFGVFGLAEVFGGIIFARWNFCEMEKQEKASFATTSKATPKDGAITGAPSGLSAPSGSSAVLRVAAVVAVAALLVSAAADFARAQSAETGVSGILPAGVPLEGAIAEADAEAVCNALGLSYRFFSSSAIFCHTGADPLSFSGTGSTTLGALAELRDCARGRKPITGAGPDLACGAQCPDGEVVRGNECVAGEYNQCDELPAPCRVWQTCSDTSHATTETTAELCAGPDARPCENGGTSTGGGTTCDCAVPAAAGFSGDSCEVLSAAAQNCDANAAYSFVYDEAEGGAYCDFNGAARIADFQDATNADDRCYFYRAGDLPANRAGFLCDDHFGAGNFPSSALPAEVSFNCPANSELDGTTYSCVCSSSHPRGSPPDCHALRTLTVDASAADGVLAARTSGGTDIAEGNSAQIRTDESVVFTATPDSRLHVLLRWTGACGADGVNPEIVDRGRGAQTCEVPAGRADVQAGAVFGDLPCPPNSRVINSADPTRCVCNNGYYDKVGVDGDYETLECVTRRITRDHIAVQTGGNRCVKGAFDNAQQVDPFIAEFGIPCHFGNFIVNSRDCYIVRDGQVPVAGKAIRSDSRFVEYIGGPSAVSELGNYPDRLCEVMYPACDAGLGQLPADGNNPFAGCRVTSERCLAADAHSVPHGSGGYCVCDAANNYEGEVGSCELRRTVSVSAAQNGAVVLTVRLTSAAAGETARVASAAPATFIATPDSGYYVSRWTGACAADANPSPVSAPTGEGDAPAAPQTCVVAAGTEDISAGAEFAPIEDCASRHLTQATATTCGGVDYASLAAAQRIGAAEVARSCADAGGNAGTVRATGPDFAVVNDVGRRCTFASNDPRNCHALDPGKTVPEGYAILAPESNGYCDDIHPDCSVSGGESQLANNPLSGCKYVVNLDEVDNGTLTARWTGDARFPADLDDGDFVPGGATVTFAAAPNPGYYVSLWAGCGAADENTGEHSDGARKECEAVASAPLTVSVAFADIDECRTARNNCDANAACADHPFANVAPALRMQRPVSRRRADLQSGPDGQSFAGCQRDACGGVAACRQC